MAGTHAPLAPSFAPVWANCSDAAVIALGAPDNENDATREGEAAHWVAEETLRGFRDGVETLTQSDFVGKQAPNGVIIDRDMVDGATVLVNDVLRTSDKYGALRSLLIEHKVYMPHIHEQNYGTLDAALIVGEQGKVRKIYLWDYKHGHRENKAKGNFQLIDYVEGLRAELNINGNDDQHIEVIMRIVQPNAYYADNRIDEWKCRLSDLRPYANILHYKANEVFTTPLATTGRHCRDCPGRVKCHARRQADYNLIDYVNEPYRMDDIIGPDLAREYRLLDDGMKAIKARHEAIGDEIKQRIQNGAVDTGYVVETSYGRLGWKVAAKVASTMAKNFGFNIDKDDVLTPTQAIKKAPKAVRPQFETAIKNITERPKNGAKLVPIENSLSAKAFTKE